MKRTSLLGGLLALAGLSLSVAAYQAQPAAPRVIEVEKLRDNLFVLRGNGGGGNTAVLIGESGVTVVDTKNPGWGQPILDKIKELTGKPVVRIINTHTHGDHVSGNVEFPPTVDVVTHENTKANMQKMPGAAGPNGQPGPNIFSANGGRGMSKRTFNDRMTVGSGNDQIDLYYFGRGHTNGDTWVVFPSLRTMHSGDIFSNKVAPLLDANNGGSGLEIGDSLTRAADGIKNVDTIITGHGPQMTMADLREYAQFNKDFVDYVRAGVRAGKSAEAIAAEYKVPAKYQGYTAQDARVKGNVQVVMNELTRR